MLNKKSEANLEIAKICLDKKDEDYFSAGASRAYYAIFQATKYLLVKKCFDYKKFKINNPIAKKQVNYTHGGIRKALEHFLLNNGFNSQDDLRFIDEMHTTFNKLYNWRRQGDYEETVISEKDLKEAIEIADMFTNKLKKYN
ncbi:MAG: HEPN domain-containing protein [Leptospirales bacterium]|nr:HEPN domain-containing protein [Leptospirales bacterium]